MQESTALLDRIREEWDIKNRENIIAFNSETLQIKDLPFNGLNFCLIFNASRAPYEQSRKTIPHPEACPFCGKHENEITGFSNDQFKILGNVYSCMQYQSLLIPREHVGFPGKEMFRAIINFAFDHPSVTLLYNSVNAGNAVPDHHYWLLSFHAYHNLKSISKTDPILFQNPQITIQSQKQPAYSLKFKFEGKPTSRYIEILYDLILNFLKNKNYNIFIHNNTLTLIPRNNIEIPAGFDQHRFGGLEMIGVFIMKSAEDMLHANCETLYQAIREISYPEEKQSELESLLKTEFSIPVG